MLQTKARRREPLCGCPIFSRGGGRARLWRELGAFGVVGALAFVVDNGGYTVLVFGPPGAHAGPMAGLPVAASVVATGAATLFSWLGNRYWTYGKQRRAEVGQELALFVLVNLLGVAVTAGAVWSSRNLLGVDSVATDNLARICGWVLATMLRFVAYRRYVFVARSS